MRFFSQALRGPRTKELLLFSLVFLLSVLLESSGLDIFDPMSAGATAGRVDAVEEAVQFSRRLRSQRVAESSSRDLQQLARYWSRAYESLKADSLGGSVVEKVWRERLKSAATGLAGMAGDSALDRGTLSKHLSTLRELETLLPVVKSIESGQKSVVLVVSTVACSCAIAHCEVMSELFDRFHSTHKRAAMVRIDQMSFPEISNAWDIQDVPMWAFLDPTGDLAASFEGEVDEESIASELESWLGSSPR